MFFQSEMQDHGQSRVEHNGMANWWQLPTASAPPVPTTLKIQIIRSRSRTIDSYHVHESVVVSGPRKCGCFAHQLHCMMVEDSDVKTILMELDDRAAMLFPQVLNYVYCSPKFQITTSTAVGLRFLAGHLKQPQLQDEAWKFIREDIKVAKLEYYLKDANYFQDKQTATWVAFECAHRIKQIEPSSPLLEDMAPDDFKQAINLTRLCRTGSPIHCSELVAAYCSYHIKNVDERLFKELTSPENLPMVSKKVAVRLMELEYQIRQSSRDPSQEHLSSLQKRCVQALAAQQF